MSTDFRTEKEITFEELFDGRLESFGVKEEVVEGRTAADMRCLIDGPNYVWVYGDEVVNRIRRFGNANNPNKILSAIGEAFETDIFSEHQPQYWGFETTKEWDDAEKRLHKKHQAELYVDIMKIIRGEPNSIKSGTVGMTQAYIAKELIAENPNLASPNCMEELMETIDIIYMNNHTALNELGDWGLAIMQMIAAQEDDLSHA